jgi:hypothetical protein
MGQAEEDVRPRLIPQITRLAGTDKVRLLTLPTIRLAGESKVIASGRVNVVCRLKRGHDLQVNKLNGKILNVVFIETCLNDASCQQSLL